MYSSYAHLMTMLAQGWQIEPSVYMHPRWPVLLILLGLLMLVRPLFRSR